MYKRFSESESNGDSIIIIVYRLGLAASLQHIMLCFGTSDIM